MVRVLIICSFCILFFAQAAEAQFSADLTSITGEALTITLNPAFPAPGETVTASIDDYATGVTTGSIQWFFDGQVATSTENRRSIQFVAGALGSKNTISVQIRNNNGFTVSANKTITPQYLDIIIEPQTYVPQSYRGRALPVHDSVVRAIAIFHNENGIVSPQNYNYLWRVNNTTIEGGSVRGGFQTSYVVPYGRNHTVFLEIYDLNGELVIKRAVNVQVSEVDLKLYDESPLYGLSYTTLKSPFNFIGNSVTLRAVPYNLDVRAVNQDLFTEWTIGNRTVINNSEDPFKITLERNGSGVTSVGFKLRNRVSLLQGGEVRALLQF